MPRKKRTEELQPPCLTREELYGARMYLAEAELAETQAKLVLGAKRELLKQLDPEGKLEALDQKARALVADASKKKEGYNGVIKAACERLGLSVDKYAWDDETGELRELP